MRRTLSIMLVAGLMVGAACGEGPRPEPPAAGGEERTALEYGCGGSDGATFTSESLPSAEAPSPEILAAIDRLRETMDGSFLPESGWVALAEDGTRATVLAPSDEQYAYVWFENRKGVWDPVGWGGCKPSLATGAGDRSVLQWEIAADAYPPDAGATSLDLLVIERQCSSGRELEGVIDADVYYGNERIEVLLTAPALPGGEGVGYNCIGTAPTGFTVEMDEPIGNRAVVDPSVFPVAEPPPGTL